MHRADRRNPCRIRRHTDGGTLRHKRPCVCVVCQQSVQPCDYRSARLLIRHHSDYRRAVCQTEIRRGGSGFPQCFDCQRSVRHTADGGYGLRLLFYRPLRAARRTAAHHPSLLSRNPCVDSVCGFVQRNAPVCRQPSAPIGGNVDTYFRQRCQHRVQLSAHLRQVRNA